ncbi:amino acid adenylation domain-containing protein [Marinilactibacillus psychrotolerans]|uniref:amino acid adenylation domain-containing protein n=1 Tax=Marinilactibacillus psychrotolerans TaxID=191770 RepID=UPI00388B2AC0
MTYTLTEAQKRIWFTETLYNSPSINNIVIGQILDSGIDIQKFKDTIEKYIQMNDLIRIQLRETNEVLPAQYIKDNQEVPLEYISWKLESTTADNILKKFAKTPLTLYDSPLYEVLIMNTEEGWFFCLKCHHILVDGISIDTFFTEIISLYRNEIKFSELKSSKVNFQKYLEKEEKYNCSNKLLKDKQYWLDEFKSLPAYILKESNKLVESSTNAKRMEYHLNQKLFHKMKSFAVENNTSLYAIFMTSFFIAFSEMYDEEEIIIGTYLSNRKGAEKNGLGMYVSTLPLKLKVRKNVSFKQLVEDFQVKLKESIRHQNYPYNNMLSKVRNRQKGINQLYTVGIEYQDFKGEFNQIFNGEEGNELSIHIKNYTNIDKLKLWMDYRTDLFNESQINELYKKVISMLEKTLKNKDVYVEDLMIKERMDAESVIDCFKEEVKTAPNKIAIKYGSKNWTYKELDEASDKIAAFLVQDNVVPRGNIGILMERSPYFVMCMLAILKAGLAYVPLDINAPDNWLKRAIEDGQVSKIFVSGKLKKKSLIRNSTVDIEEVLKSNIYVDNFKKSSSNNLAYVMFTSGTTGKPKGVKINQSNIINLVRDTNYFDFDKNSIILQLAPMIFDASTFEVWGALLNGNTLVMMEEDKPTPEEIGQVISKHKVTSLFMTTALFNLSVDMNSSIFNNVEEVLFGGESVSFNHVRKFRENNKRTRLVHVYGPTENTTFSTYFDITEESLNNDYIPIGKALSGTEAYILDENLNLIDGEQEGELFLAGEGISSGYINSEKKTLEKFVSIPYLSDEVFYKTGDFVKYDNDKNIIFIGRRDHQIKIRGHRIELEEIENVLLKNSYVKSAKVLKEVKGSNSSFLTAYVSISNNKKHKIQEYLENELPDYMLPNKIVVVDSMPLNLNGKIDTSKLVSINKEIHNGPDRKEIDSRYDDFKDVWKTVLNLDHIDIDDDFFEIGGDSIKAIQIISKLRNEEHHLKVSEILRYRTIRRICSNVMPAMKNEENHIKYSSAPLTPIQSEYFSEIDIYGDDLCQSVLIEVKKEIDKETLSEIMKELLSTHDSLRLNFRNESGEWKQYLGEIDRNNVLIKDNRGIDDYESIEEMIYNLSNNPQQSLSIENDQLIRVDILGSRKNNYLLITIHHLIIDGVSWRVLLEDLGSLLSNLSLSKNMKSTTSYLTWAHALKEYAKKEEILKEAKYWNKVISEGSSGTFKRKMEVLERSINLGDKEYIKSYYNKNINLQTVLLTCLSKSVKLLNFTGKDVVITLEGHGREEITKDLSLDRSIGWFTTCYPVKLPLYSEDKSKEENLKDVSNCLQRVPNKGIGFTVLNNSEHTNILSSKTLEGNIRFNFLGSFTDVNTEINLLKIQPTRLLEEELYSKFYLEINTYILSNRLCIEVLYDNSTYAYTDIDAFISDFFQNTEKYYNEKSKDCSDYEKEELDIISELINLEED